MTVIDITHGEIECGQMIPEHLEAAVHALREDGFVILDHIVSLDHIALLREKMMEDLPRFVSREDAPFNFNRGNIQHDPPPFPPYLFRDVLVNDLVIAVTHTLLGNGVKNGYYSGNTALRTRQSQRQPPHVDVGQLWPGLREATPAFGLVINVPLVDMDSENGSTELWPGTHQDTSVCVQCGDLKVPEERLAARGALAPPFQPIVPAGSIIIRDIRLWHAGMPNQRDQPRPMIAMIHWINWWNDFDLPSFPRSTQSFFAHPVLTTRAHFVDGNIDYVHHSQAFDFQKDAAET